MNRALIHTSDKERAERLAQFRADMAQLDEPENTEAREITDALLGMACIVVLFVAGLFLIAAFGG